MVQINELDWKLFRKKLPEWQETHMDKLNQEYATLLAGSGNASEKFWELEKRINSDKKHVGVMVRMSRSNMHQNILALLSEEVITLKDLDDFSEELRENFAFLTRK